MTGKLKFCGFCPRGLHILPSRCQKITKTQQNAVSNTNTVTVYRTKQQPTATCTANGQSWHIYLKPDHSYKASVDLYHLHK